MKITLKIGAVSTDERTAIAEIDAQQLACVYLNVSFPEERNRSRLYIHRPAKPDRQSKDRFKIPIKEHIAAMRAKPEGTGGIPSPTRPTLHHTRRGTEIFGTVPAMLAVPISDLVANLLRPCFHRDRLGNYRLFYLQNEPIDKKQNYWCVCSFGDAKNYRGLQLREVRFDANKDTVFDNRTDRDLLNEESLTWAAALVPLVIDGRPLSAVEIAQNNYDLRQIFGLDDSYETTINYIYDGWFDEWNSRVEEKVLQHENSGRPFATFYHSILALDEHNNVNIWQIEGTLPELAKKLVKKGMVNAGLLDSGGSCAMYDVWMGTYLNHGWYYRESRGSILVFELKSHERYPMDAEDVWTHH